MDKIISKYIIIYFNMYNKVEKLIRLPVLSKKRRWLSSRKAFVSKLQVKHSNDKITINVHIYDRTNLMISRNLKLLSLDLKGIFIKRSLLLGIYNSYNHLSIFSEKMKNHYSRKLDVNYNLLSKLYTLNKALYLKDKFWKQTKKLLFSYRFMLLNTLRYKNIFIHILLKLVSKLYYNKKIVLNVILLKNYYLNSDILTQILALKIKNRKNNANILFRRALNKIKVPSFRKGIMSRIVKDKIPYNTRVSNSGYKNSNLDKLIRDSYKANLNLENFVLDRLYNKSIVGVRFEGAGRLTKRFSAQRAVTRVKYTGSLKNMDSAFRGISSQMLRNNINSNLQFSRMKSQNRIGSFGIKGWINSV